MTLRGFLTWYLGAVVFVGTAGASGYQVLYRHQADVAASQATAQAPDIAPLPPTVAAAAPSTPYNIADATEPPQPPEPQVEKQVEKRPIGHASKWVKPV